MLHLYICITLIKIMMLQHLQQVNWKLICTVGNWVLIVESRSLPNTLFAEREESELIDSLSLPGEAMYLMVLITEEVDVQWIK